MQKLDLPRASDPKNTNFRENREFRIFVFLYFRHFDRVGKVSATQKTVIFIEK